LHRGIIRGSLAFIIRRTVKVSHSIRSHSRDTCITRIHSDIIYRDVFVIYVAIIRRRPLHRSVRFVIINEIFKCGNAFESSVDLA